MVIHLFMSFTFSYAFCSSVGPVVNGRARRSGSCLLASAEAVLPGLDGLSDEEARAARWLASDEMGQAHVLAAFDGASVEDRRRLLAQVAEMDANYPSDAQGRSGLSAYVAHARELILEKVVEDHHEPTMQWVSFLLNYITHWESVIVNGGGKPFDDDVKINHFLSQLPTCYDQIKLMLKSKNLTTFHGVIGELTTMVTDNETNRELQQRLLGVGLHAELAEHLVRDAGFQRFEPLAIDHPVNAFYLVRPRAA